MKKKAKDVFIQSVLYAILIVLIVGSGSVCSWILKTWLAANGVFLR